MKRLLFAGMILLLSPASVCTQTKAGKTDTMQHAVFYTHTAGAGCSANTGNVFYAKENNGNKRVRSGHAHICIRTATGSRTNRSSKELMKMAVTGNQ